MLELGEAGPTEHGALADDVARSADLVFTCGPLMRRVFDAIPLAIRGQHAEDAAALAPIVANRVEAGDTILVKGSLGSRMRVIVQALDALAGTAAASVSNVVSDLRTTGTAKVARRNGTAASANALEGPAG
jgi:UDP-N-acetylmuramoyl-tripeptide--D-alanyl-D-alanine ligase